jgi:hypothetical protein
MGLQAEDSEKLSSIVSILRTAPLIEKLEIGVSAFLDSYVPSHSICFQPLPCFCSW